VRDLGVPGTPSTARQAAIDALIATGMDGKLDRKRLEDALTRVMDPDRTGRPRGEIFRVDAKAYTTVIEARLEAMRHIDRIDDSLFIWARILYQVTRSDYRAEQPQLATDPEVGHLATTPTLEAIANSACLDLLTLIGFVLLSMKPDAPAESAFFDPNRSPFASNVETGAPG
jgi:hypothetical protein